VSCACAWRPAGHSLTCEADDGYSATGTHKASSEGVGGIPACQRNYRTASSSGCRGAAGGVLQGLAGSRRRGRSK